MRKWSGRWLVLGSILLGAVGLVALTSKATATTAFCASCHEMNYTAVETWRIGPHGDHSGKAVAGCSDCHVEPTAAGWLEAKAGGVRKVYVHLTSAPERAAWEQDLIYRSREIRAAISDGPCLQCHDLKHLRPQTPAGKTAHDAEIGRALCLDCHATIGHGPR
jgi:nitrate/TMAO reductase-like tetraheme cytochrome c subunit